MKTILVLLLISFQFSYAQNAESFFNTGTNLNNQGEYTKALDYFNQAIAIDSTYAAAYNNRGFSKDKLMKYSEAIKDFEKALEYYNGEFCHSCCYINIGLAYGKSNNLDKAIESFKTAIEIKPKYGEAFYDLGYAYHLQNKSDLACENWRKAAEYNYSAAEGMIKEYCKD